METGDLSRRTKYRGGVTRDGEYDGHGWMDMQDKDI
jgi:hypothetical protein